MSHVLIPLVSFPPPGRNTQGGRLLSHTHRNGSGWMAATPWWNLSTPSDEPETKNRWISEIGVFDHCQKTGLFWQWPLVPWLSTQYIWVRRKWLTLKPIHLTVDLQDKQTGQTFRRGKSNTYLERSVMIREGTAECNSPEMAHYIPAWCWVMILEIIYDQIKHDHPWLCILSPPLLTALLTARPPWHTYTLQSFSLNSVTSVIAGLRAFMHLSCIMSQGINAKSIKEGSQP